MWQRVGTAFDEAFERLAAVLAADLPGIIAMLLVVLGATVTAFVDAIASERYDAIICRADQHESIDECLMMWRKGYKFWSGHATSRVPF